MYMIRDKRIERIKKQIDELYNDEKVELLYQLSCQAIEKKLFNVKIMDLWNPKKK